MLLGTVQCSEPQSIYNLYTRHLCSRVLLQQLADFDATLSNILDFGLENPVIFNCQMGIGRTTAGMVIASLVHLYSTGCMGQDERATSSKLEGLDALNLSGYIMGGISPRSDNEGDEFREEDDEKESKVGGRPPSSETRSHM